ncbi:CWF19-like protein 2 isoform X2 [Hemicordylus capensis]|uniref:CWF19-like protein 2 isoform X2 n=1 Tax=Hemicordylus capensis TaxID=884348 RepID=UPI0023026DE6|nr:CWF19-like protein 2 isoform X2 [Hemicordylus capensis]
MASGFESERSLAARKEEKRHQRQALLQQAKADYEKEERRKELKRLRGEDTWMLPNVNERVEELGKEHSVTKKKKKGKHSRKHKKEKKHKAEKNNDSSGSGSDSSEEWVEAPVSQSSSTEKAWKVKKEQLDPEESLAVVQRDEWMTLDFMSVKTLSSASLKAEKQMEKLLEQQKAQANEQSVLSKRELNPYWKDGGTGLPSEEDISTKATLVEDGGLSWLKKSYQRMKEQSEREKRNLEEIVAERYGSVEIFHSRLEEAERAAAPKESDCRSWQKHKYSKTECSVRKGKEKQEESDVEKGAYKEQAKERYKEYSPEWRSRKRDKPTGEKVPRHHNKESSTKDFSYGTAKGSYQRSNYEKPFWSPLKATFLKPNEDGEQESRLQSSSSKLVTPAPVSHGFRKPGDDTEVIPTWLKIQPQDGDGKANLNEKAFKMEVAVTSGEKEEEIAGDGLEKKELSDSKSTHFGSNSEGESPCILSEEEMNRLGAKIVKAELMGNKDLAAKLQVQLDKARKRKESGAQIPARESERETSGFQEDHDVILVRTDKTGRAWPVSTSGVPLEPKGGRRKRPQIATHMDKERVRYFQDDDNLSLKDLVRNEKMRTAEDQNKLFMRMASKFSDKTDREYYTLDDMFVSKAAKGEHSGEEEERQRKQAIHEHRKFAACMEKCPHCFGSPELPKHLIIAIGNKVYLSLPNYQSLTEGHCLIAPMQHYTAATLLDEDIWEEIQIFRKTLKAIMESDEEWSMNKKLIDLSSKDVRKSVPKGLPYFAVDFGLQGGFAHVVEDQHKFPFYFGKEIIGGMLDLEPRLWRKGLQENFEDQRRKVLQFAQSWKAFDFTKSKE